MSEQDQSGVTIRHTKGPWNFHPFFNPMTFETSRTDTFEYFSVSIACGTKLIGEVTMIKADEGIDTGYPRVDNAEETRANARLIVASPEMLDLLLAFREDIVVGATMPDYLQVELERVLLKAGAITTNDT